MPFRFRKSVKILPGVKVNLSKSGASVSAGRRGATVNVGKKGVKQTVGIPGTGISHTSSSRADSFNVIFGAIVILGICYTLVRWIF